MKGRPLAAAPTEASLHEAALAYLAQRATSIVRMKRVLERKIATWARRADKAGESAERIEAAVANAENAVPRVIERLRAIGYLDDAAFAERRAERLTRAGKSRRAVSLDLVRNGIASELARRFTPEDATTELSAAVALTKKKRIGAFARLDEDEDVDPDLKRRWLGALARAGYSFETANRVLRMARDEADSLLRGVR